MQSVLLPYSYRDAPVRISYPDVIRDYWPLRRSSWTA